MWEFYINLRAFDQVQDFVRLACQQKFDVTVGNDHQTINGKDLMGMFSLDYSRPVQVIAECAQELFEEFRQAVEHALS